MPQSSRWDLTRRGFLRVGGSSLLGFGFSPLLAGQARGASSGRARSVVIVFLTGGPSQLETFDLKPQAPAEIRGESQPIATATPGVHICEHLPQLAQRTGKLAIVRTMAHRELNHLLATHEILTGRPTPNPRGGSDLDRQQSREDFPNYAAALNYLRPRAGGIPSGVSLPNYLIEGPLTWPGQHAGFLGVRYDPWQINQDPNDANFRVDSITLGEGVTPQRLDARRELLGGIEEVRTDGLGPSAARDFADQQEIAFSLLTSGRVSQAFDIQREPEQVRERYGRNKLGQSLLLARRLVEAGVPMVEASMGIVQTWDTHVDNWGRLKNTLLPQLDAGVSALLDDLSASGLLDETLVIVTGEFGRTPTVSTLPGQTIPGRDHWAATYSAVFAGAGVRGGQVIGQSDAQAAYPLTRTYSPGDLCTTIFDALGVELDAEIHDRLGRPVRLCNGDVIDALYSGAGT